MHHPHPHPYTQVVTSGRPERVPDAPFNQPVTFASTYVAGGHMEYARYGNPTWSALENAIGDLEGGECIAFSSGVAGAIAVLEQVRHGGRIVVPQHTYQGVLSLLGKWEQQGRIFVDSVNLAEPDALHAAVAGADMVWVESPTNPALEIIDLDALSRVTKAAGVPLAVDNTFATPLRQRPLEHGADYVVHSATKLLAGHSDVVLGAVVAADPLLAQQVRDYRGMHGSVPGPMEVFLTLRGLRTLGVRLDRAEENATAIAEALAEHPEVMDVRYPGFGTIVSFILPDVDAADRVIAAARLIGHATSLGGVESTMERRRRWPTEAQTIPDALIRLSVGIEHSADLIADLEQALHAVVEPHSATAPQVVHST